ncbi:MAG TPA: protein kinase [Polyangia bacterium]|nr:protein kinase [Polyangia bacterium]
MELGKGGMGIAHLAMSRGPQGFTKLLVLKIMRRELVAEADLLRMFQEEARISARLAHPNIVHVFEVDEHEGCPCIVMEYLEGQPLSSLLTRAPQRPPLALHLHILARALSGLHAAHELRDYDGTALRLVHRDVSPHNVFVLFDGQVKMLDFGIAKAAGSEIETRTGTPKGKIRYMPPEQLLRDPLDRRADVFSVGVLLWEALAGRRLWAEMQEGEVTRALLNCKIPALPDDDRIPAELRAISARALAADPADRYPTAEAFQRDLDRYLAAQPVPCGADELGAYLRTQFGDLRQATKKLIDFHIKSVQGGGTPVRTPTGSVRRLTTGFPATPGRTGATAMGALAIAAGLPAAAPPEEQGETMTRAYPPPAAAALEPDMVIATPMPLSAQPTPSRHWNRLVVAGAIGGLLAFLLAGATFLRGGSPRTQGRGGEQGTAAATGGPSGAVALAACAPGFKRCGAECVSIERPDFGCGGDSCQSCQLQNATARCNLRHECDTAICYQSFDDCDGNSHNGCETDLRIDPDHCGACAHKCPQFPHAQRGCGDTCTIWRCNAGYGDCNGVAQDGCESILLNDARHCGHCGAACAAGQHCRRGACVR